MKDNEVDLQVQKKIIKLNRNNNAIGKDPQLNHKKNPFPSGYSSQLQQFDKIARGLKGSQSPISNSQKMFATMAHFQSLQKQGEEAPHFQNKQLKQVRTDQMNSATSPGFRYISNAYLNSAGASNMLDQVRKNSSSAGGYRAQKLAGFGTAASNGQNLKGAYYASQKMFLDPKASSKGMKSSSHLAREITNQSSNMHDDLVRNQSSYISQRLQDDSIEEIVKTQTNPRRTQVVASRAQNDSPDRVFDKSMLQVGNDSVLSNNMYFIHSHEDLAANSVGSSVSQERRHTAATAAHQLSQMRHNSLKKKQKEDVVLLNFNKSLLSSQSLLQLQRASQNDSSLLNQLDQSLMRGSSKGQQNGPRYLAMSYALKQQQQSQPKLSQQQSTAYPMQNLKRSRNFNSRSNKQISQLRNLPAASVTQQNFLDQQNRSLTNLTGGRGGTMRLTQQNMKINDYLDSQVSNLREKIQDKRLQGFNTRESSKKRSSPTRPFDLKSASTFRKANRRIEYTHTENIIDEARMRNFIWQNTKTTAGTRQTDHTQQSKLNIQDQTTSGDELEKPLKKMITVSQLFEDTAISNNPLSQETLSKSASKEQLHARRMTNPVKKAHISKKPIALKKKESTKKKETKAKNSPVAAKPLIAPASPGLKVVHEDKAASTNSLQGPIQANIAAMKRKSMIYTQKPTMSRNNLMPFDQRSRNSRNNIDKETSLNDSQLLIGKDELKNSDSAASNVLSEKALDFSSKREKAATFKQMRTAVIKEEKPPAVISNGLGPMSNAPNIDEEFFKNYDREINMLSQKPGHPLLSSNARLKAKTKRSLKVVTRGNKSIEKQRPSLKDTKFKQHSKTLGKLIDKELGPGKVSTEPDEKTKTKELSSSLTARPRKGSPKAMRLSPNLRSKKQLTTQRANAPSMIQHKLKLTTSDTPAVSYGRRPMGESEMVRHHDRDNSQGSTSRSASGHHRQSLIAPANFDGHKSMGDPPSLKHPEGLSRLNSNGVADTCSKHTMEQNKHNLTALKNIYLDEAGRIRFDASLKLGRSQHLQSSNSHEVMQAQQETRATKEKIIMVNRDIKKLLFSATKIVCNQNEQHITLSFDRGTKIEVLRGSVYHLKLNVKGQKPPAKIFFEYTQNNKKEAGEQQQDGKQEKKKETNLIYVYHSFKHRLPNLDHCQGKDNTPKILEIEPDYEDEAMAAQAKAVAPVFHKEWLYLTLKDNESTAHDLSITIRAKAGRERPAGTALVLKGVPQSASQIPAGMSMFKADIVKKVQVLVSDKEKYNEFRAELDDIRGRSIEGRNSPMKIVASSLEDDMDDGSPIRCNFDLSGGFQDHIEKNKNFLKTAAANMSNQLVRLEAQIRKHSQKQQAMKSVEDRKNQIEIDNYKKKVFLLMRRNLLKSFRKEQDEYQFNLYLMRKKTLRYNQIVTAHNVIHTVFNNFKNLKEKIILHKWRTKCTNRIKACYRNTISRKGKTIELRRQVDIKNSLTLAGFLKNRLAVSEARKAIHELVSEYAQNQATKDKVVNFCKQVVVIQRVYKECIQTRENRMDTIEIIWSSLAKHKIQQCMKTNQRIQKNKDKLKKLVVFQKETQIAETICKNYYKYMKLRFQIRDFYDLLSVHNAKFLILAQQPALRKRADWHNQTYMKYKARVEKFLTECEYLQTHLGLVEVKTTKHKHHKGKKKHKDQKELTIAERILKLEIMTPAEIEMIEIQSQYGSNFVRTPNNGEASSRVIELDEEKGKAMADDEIEPAVHFHPSEEVKEEIKEDVRFLQKISFKWIPEEEQLSKIFDHNFASYVAAFKQNEAAEN